jgi:predicted transcriptional regulator
MGIPYYFYSLTQKYNTIISSNKPTGLDTYCIDFNGIIHNVAQDIIKKYKDTAETVNNIESAKAAPIANGLPVATITYTKNNVPRNSAK